MKTNLAVLLILLTSAFSRAQNPTPLADRPLNAVLDSLDRIIADPEPYVEMKRQRIAALLQNKRPQATPEEVYSFGTLLYKEYYVFDADSALYYADCCLNAAQQLGRADWEAEAKIRRAFVLAATGLLEDSERLLDTLNAAQLPPQLRTEYYRQRIYNASHYLQYYPSGEVSEHYAKRSEEYHDSIAPLVTPDDPLNLWQRAWSPEAPAVREELLEVLRRSPLDNRTDAMNAYALAHIFKNEGNTAEAQRFFALSAIADVRSCNHDMASLEELALMRYEAGDVSRANDYIDFCLQSDRVYHNRVRIVSLSPILDQIHAAHKRLQQREHRQILTLLGLSVLLLLLLAAALFFLHRTMRRRKTLAQQLQDNNLQLQAANDEASRALRQLEAQTESLQTLSRELRESNYVKEETIGYVFSICSDYISKLDDYRRNIYRQLKTNRYDELLQQTKDSIVQRETREFFRTFDEVFLKIYPNFVEDYNSLLRPEERITLREGAGLNTELRIFALVRLGINDSQRIAEFLHCSPQTVYNNRQRARNAALVDKAAFQSSVEHLGTPAVGD